MLFFLWISIISCTIYKVSAQNDYPGYYYQGKYYYYTGENGSVRIKEEKYPEIFLNGNWLPICGHYFWDNNYGADLFCQKLDPKFTNGIISKSHGKRLASDGVRIGKCQPEDQQLLSCTGGGNDLGIGNGFATANCEAGQLAAVEIQCYTVSEKIDTQQPQVYEQIGSVRLLEEKFPEVFWNGVWTPICGHWFWNNDYGADLFCQKLDSKYVSGTVIKRKDVKLRQNGFQIGECKIDDNSLLACTGGCNDLKTGNGHCAKCGVGQKAAINIKCHESRLVEKVFLIAYQNVLWDQLHRCIELPRECDSDISLE